MPRFGPAIFSLAALVLVAMMMSCATKTVGPIQYQPDQPTDKGVVLLYHPTLYKEELVHGLAKMLRANGVHVVTDNLCNRDQYPPGRCTVVVLVATVQGLRANKDAITYLRDHREAKNILLVSTSGRGFLSGIELFKDIHAPDAVTGASSTDCMGAMADRIHRIIMEKLRDPAAIPWNPL